LHALFVILTVNFVSIFVNERGVLVDDSALEATMLDNLQVASVSNSNVELGDARRTSL